MIVLDGSALLAYLLDEPDAERCEQVFAGSDRFLISAASLAELLIVAGRKGVLDQVEQLLASLAPDVITLTRQGAAAAAAAYRRWGKGSQRAKLNIMDCFAYALAMEHSCPLLFVGDDFAKTDVTPARA